MDASERTNAIKAAVKSSADARLWVFDEWRNIPVIRVPVSALVLNIDNRRFAAERQLFEERLGRSLDPENSDADALSVEAILLDRDLEVDGDKVVGKAGKDYEALRQDWIRRSQETPFWIRSDGTVRNGNRRLAMLRRLQREQGALGFEYVEAVVLDDIGLDELAIFEMEQREQLTEDYKVRYTDINLLLAIKDAAEDRRIDWFDPESITRVARELQHVMRNDPRYAEVQLYAIKYMDAYLSDLGISDRYDKLIGQIERFRDVGRAMRAAQEEEPERAPDMLNALFAGVSAGLTHLEIRRVRRLFNEDPDEFDRLVEQIENSESTWEQPIAEDALGDPDLTTPEEDDVNVPDQLPEPPGPVVTNYPKDVIKDIFYNSLDRHSAAQDPDVLRIVREINNRLSSLINDDDDRLSPALEGGSKSELQEAVTSMASWFDRNRAALG